MDLNGGRRPTPLIEEPRRPPWMVIILVIAALVVVGWVASNVRVRIDLPEGPAPAGDEERPIPIEPDSEPSRVVESAGRELVPPPSTAGPTKWAEVPAPRYPRRGFRAPGGEGRVTLSCLVRGDRRLETCQIAAEDPEGYGFGRSALAAASEARVATEVPPGARVQFSIRYVLPE